MNESILIVEDQFVEADFLQNALTKAGYSVCGIARSVPAALKLIDEKKPNWVLIDIFLQGEKTGVDLANMLHSRGIAFIFTSANSNQHILDAAKKTKPYGFLVKPFRDKDILVSLDVARYLHQQNTETTTRREAGLKKQLELISEEGKDVASRLQLIAKAFQPYIPFDLIFYCPAAGKGDMNDVKGFLRTGYENYESVTLADVFAKLQITEQGFRALERTTHQQAASQEITTSVVGLEGIIENYFKMRSSCALFLKDSSQGDSLILLFSKGEAVFEADHVALFNRWSALIAEAIQGTNQGQNKQPDEAQEKLHALKNPFAGIIGKSHKLLAVLDSVMTVAHKTTSVLILGESGTGKERIADAIHENSPRKDKPFIKVNCAALPASLIESELFGHERGSFSGATERRIGKFELANDGTIFLDEIGEMPYDMQVKLLRVLQEKELERVGGNVTIKINVRVIAATNRNLEKEVAAGKFRIDLYYRLNVFPIVLPSLRERKEDIPVLADHFVAYYARKSGMKTAGLSARMLTRMTEYNWPGNIRELENFIERCILVSKGGLIDDVIIPETYTSPLVETKEETNYIKTIDENERDHIIAVIEKCNGRISGRGGAAELLGLPVSTLNSRMKKLGITKTKKYS